MTEAIERICKLYGPPASNEQIRLYFESLLQTYIELAEKYPIKIRAKFEWFSKRPFKVLFYSSPTTVCFTLIGNAEAKGVEGVKDVSLISPKKGTVCLRSGTSLNGQKLYSMEYAIREATSKVNEELERIKLPTIKENIVAVGNELNKNDPDLKELRKSYESLHQIMTSVGESRKRFKENQVDRVHFSPFQKFDMSPLVTMHEERFKKIEKEFLSFEQKINDMKEHFKTSKDITNGSVKFLRDEITSKESKKVNRWVITGIIFSIIIGLIGIILRFIPSLPVHLPN